MVKFLVCALFYGDHPGLAERCGRSLRALWNTGRVDLRIGCNEVSPRSAEVLGKLLPGVPVERADPQICKYPMIRRLLAGYRGDATHLMWFDDDSYLLPTVEARGWLDAVAERAARATGSLGSLYRHPLSKAQRRWIERQPWYTGREMGEDVLFSYGGWFVVPLELIRRCDWPSPGLMHDSGDSVLGALLHQQGLAPEQFRMGVAINADAEGVEGASPRRGLSTPRTNPWSP